MFPHAFVALVLLVAKEDHRLMEIMKNAHSGEVMVAEIPNILNFSQVAKILGTGRTTKQCRDRWKNYLRGGIKKGDWTTEECDLINDLYTTFGAR